MNLTQEATPNALPSTSSTLLAGPHNRFRFVSDSEAGPYLGTTAATLRRWRFEGRGPKYCKIGSNVRYRVAWLEEYLAKYTIQTRDSAGPEVA